MKHGKTDGVQIEAALTLAYISIGTISFRYEEPSWTIRTPRNYQNGDFKNRFSSSNTSWDLHKFSASKSPQFAAKVSFALKGVGGGGRQKYSSILNRLCKLT